MRGVLKMMQHVMPRTRAHVGTRVFQIHTTLAICILAVDAAGSFPTWRVLAPDCDRAVPPDLPGPGSL